MSAEAEEIYKAKNFKVDINGTELGFKEVQLPNMSFQEVEYREGSDPSHMSKKPGAGDKGSVTLVRGDDGDTTLGEWFKSVREEGAENHKRDITVTVIKKDGTNGPSWVFEGCWPTEYNPADLTAGQSDAATQTVEATYDTAYRQAGY